MPQKQTRFQVTIKVYLRNSGGTVYEYDITAKSEEELGAKAREHIGQIAMQGYRHNSGTGSLTHYMPHWIDKIVVVGNISTGYPDKASGT